jgi:hypothetical protein
MCSKCLCWPSGSPGISGNAGSARSPGRSRSSRIIGECYKSRSDGSNGSNGSRRSNRSNRSSRSCWICKQCARTHWCNRSNGCTGPSRKCYKHRTYGCNKHRNWTYRCNRATWKCNLYRANRYHGCNWNTGNTRIHGSNRSNGCHRSNWNAGIHGVYWTVWTYRSNWISRICRGCRSSWFNWKRRSHWSYGWIYMDIRKQRGNLLCSGWNHAQRILCK